MLNKTRCICLTATPDDNDRKGAEKQVITALKLTKYTFGFPAEQFAQAHIDRTVTLADNEATLAFLIEEIRIRPVLFYCSTETKDYILSMGQAFISADGIYADELSLRNLDKRVNMDSYGLVLATTDQSMRGVDYRAPTTGITLVIGKSLPNAREAQQALKRVGRLNDSC
jgi:hypothetical protein